MEVTAMQFPHKTSVVSRKQYEEHITLYNGYINMINLTDKTLAMHPEYATANASGGNYRGWKKAETYSLNGVILHELYFQNLGEEILAPGVKMQKLAEKYFGGMDKWKQDFTACATAARGWCVFVYEQRTASCRNILLDVHNEGQVISSFPIIILDMYEHAYFLDYGTDKANYIKKFIENIPWGVIEKRAGVII